MTRKNGLITRPVVKNRTIRFPACPPPAFQTPRQKIQVFKWGFSFFLAGFTFALGIFLGRTTTPVYLNSVPVEAELAALEAAELAHENAIIQEGAQMLAQLKPDFYDSLRTGKSGASDAVSEITPPEETPPLSIKRPLVRKNMDRAPQDGSESAVPSPEDGEIIPASRDAAAGKFLIQVASFTQSTEADRLVTTLRQRGFEGAYQAQESISGVGMRYRVKLGHFIDKTTATQALTRLKKQERLSDAYIIQKKE